MISNSKSEMPSEIVCLIVVLFWKNSKFCFFWVKNEFAQRRNQVFILLSSYWACFWTESILKFLSISIRRAVLSAKRRLVVLFLSWLTRPWTKTMYKSGLRAPPWGTLQIQKWHFHFVFCQHKPLLFFQSSNCKTKWLWTASNTSPRSLWILYKKPSVQYQTPSQHQKQTAKHCCFSSSKCSQFQPFWQAVFQLISQVESLLVGKATSFCISNKNDILLTIILSSIFATQASSEIGR